MIEVRNLIFEYPTKRALDQIDCTIRAGSVTALVGPNGAGKTTLIRCIVGLAAPFHGTVLFDGTDVHQHPREVHRRMGYLSDFFGVYDDLTVRRCLVYNARAYSVPEEDQDSAVRIAADRLGITPYLDAKAGTLSRGLRQRLAIAQAIIHRPPFLVLDEPASGLDPEAREDLSAMLLSLQADGMTILVSSHILAELENYCSDMLIMRDGRIVDTQHLTGAREAGIRLRLDLAADYAALAAELAEIAGLSDIQIDGASATFSFSGDVAARQALLRRLVERDVPVIGLGEARVGLQDTYLASVRAERGGAG